VLHCLIGREMHFLELERALSGVSRKVLKEQLQVFQDNGLVLRRQKSDARRRVGYSLTCKGQALGTILSQIFDWSLEYQDA